MAGSIYDVALAYLAMAGDEPQTPELRGMPPANLKDFEKTSDLSGLKVGVYRKYFQDADSEIVQSCDMALDLLSAAGAEIVEITIANLDAIRLSHLCTIASEFAQSMDKYFCHNRSLT